MKKAGFSCIPLFILLLFFAPLSFAQNITTGNATAKSTVKTTTSGDGNTSTHIETTVNGKTTVIDSDDEGEIEVENHNGNVTIKKSPNVTVTISETKTATPTPTIILKEERKLQFVSNLLEKIFGFIKRIFTNL